MPRLLRVRAKSILAVAIGFAALTPVSNAAARSDGPIVEPKSRGFAFETHLASGSALALPFANGFFAGYKYHRVFVGLGLDFHYERSKITNYDGWVGPVGTRNEDTTVIMGVSEVQVVLSGVYGTHAQFVAVAGIGLGTRSINRAVDPLTLQWHVGPAFRTWAHPSLAFDVTLGVRAQHDFMSSRTETAFVPFLKLGLLAVF